MTPELIGAIFTGLTGVIAALAALLGSRQHRVQVDQRALRTRVRLLERRVIALTTYTFSLELEIAQNGGVPPTRPAILRELDDDDDADGPDDAPRGRHHRRA
jgi:hypothetical protein